VDPVTFAKTKSWVNSAVPIRQKLIGRAPFPLDIPTYDGNPNVTHPDVVYVPEGWNGYKYWMAYTPYPEFTRENPSILCSNDGLHWRVPSGLTNPIAKPGDTTESILSDPDMLLVNGEMWVYFRGYAGNVRERIYLTKSSDGVTWSFPTMVIDQSGAGKSDITLSPAVVWDEALEKFVMFTVSRAAPSSIQRRVSDDGAVWGEPTNCAVSFPVGVSPWHIDVQYADGKYHALLNTQTNNGIGMRLYYLSSDDGLTWAMSSQPVVSLGDDPDDWDRSGHYRSALTYLEDGKFGIWACGVNSPAPNGYVYQNGSRWRIGYVEAILDENGDLQVHYPFAHVDSIQVRDTRLFGRRHSERLYPVVFASHAGSQTLTANEWNKIAYTDRHVDPEGVYDSANSQFMPREGGIYLIEAATRLVSFTAPLTVRMILRVNGNDYSELFQGTATGGTEWTVGGVTLASLNAGDVVEVYINPSAQVATQNQVQHTKRFRIVKIL